VVYYAGHGMEVDGTNYLIPVDAKLERDTDVYDEALSLDRILIAIEPVKKLRLVILDACRDNPFAKTMKRTVASRSIGQGLAKIEPTSPNVLIAYSAKAGSTAEDGAAEQKRLATEQSLAGRAAQDKGVDGKAHADKAASATPATADKDKNINLAALTAAPRRLPDRQRRRRLERSFAALADAVQPLRRYQTRREARQRRRARCDQAEIIAGLSAGVRARLQGRWRQLQQDRVRRGLIPQR
jgi:hypothetical protein